jgi:hypothetical protein
VELMQDDAEKFSDLEHEILLQLKKTSMDYHLIRHYDNLLHDKVLPLVTEINYLENVWQNTKQIYERQERAPLGFAEYIPPFKEDMITWINQKYKIE